MTEENSIVLLDEGALDKFFTDAPEPEKKVEETPKPIETQVVTQTQIANETQFETEFGNEKVVAGTETSTETQEVNGNYKAVLDYWQKTGFIPELEIGEDVEVNEDFITEVLDRTKDNYIEAFAQEALDRIGDIGQKLVEFVNAGGSPEEIVNLFQKEQKIKAIDTSSEYGKRQLLTKYYQEQLNWKPERIEKHLDRLIVDEALEEEVSDISEKYQEVLQQEQEELIAAQKQQQQLEQQKINQRKSLLEAELKERKFDSKKINEMKSYVFDDKYKLKTGELISEFDLEILKIQSNPKQLAEFISWMKDPESYIESKVTQKLNTKNDKTFKLIPEVSKKTTTQTEGSSKPKFNFKF